MRLETRAIDGGQDPHPTTGATVVPNHQTSTFAQEEVGGRRGYEYPGHPTPPMHVVKGTSLFVLGESLDESSRRSSSAPR